MSLTNENEKQIENNNLKIDILKQKIDKNRKRFLLKNIKSLATISFVGLGIIGISFLGMIGCMALGLPYGFPFGVALIGGCVTTLMPTIMVVLAIENISRLRKKIETLKKGNSEINKEQVSSLVYETVLNNDLSKIEKEDEKLKMLNDKTQEYELSPLEPTILIDENEIQNDIDPYYHTPKTLNKGPRK